MSRAGEFSCPLHAAAVFVAHVNADAAFRLAQGCDAHLQLLKGIADDPVVQRFDDALDVDTVLGDAAAGSLPPAAHVSTPDGAAHVVEFEPQWAGAASSSAGVHVRPVAWFSFFSRQQREEWVARQGGEASDEEEEDGEQGAIDIFPHARRQSTRHRHTYERWCIFLARDLATYTTGFAPRCSAPMPATCSLSSSSPVRT